MTTPARKAGWVAIQLNPRSGSRSQRGRVLELERTLRAAGLRPRVFEDRDELAGWCAELIRHEGDALICIVAAGGDGTVADVFNRFPGAPVAILPAGTENLLARFLKIPQSGRAVGQIIVEGARRKLDLCQLGARRFALMASAGFDAEVVRRLHGARTGRIRRSSYFQPIWQTLRMYDYPELRLWVDDQPAPLVGRLAIAVNLPAYALGLPVAAAARGDDGFVDLRLFQRGSAFQILRYFLNLLTAGHERLGDVCSLQARRIRIESDRPVPLQVDGDPAGWTPAEISVLPAALEVFVNATAAGGQPGV